MPLHASDNANALAPEPFPEDKSKANAQYFEDGADELVDEKLAPHVPETLQGLTAEERQVLEKKLVRKIDIRLLPILVLMYIMNYLDRNNIASAKLAGKTGMVKDLGMTSTQYSTCVSILFVGYILMQVPSNLFLSKCGRPALYLPSVMIVWGIISGSTAAAQSYGSVVAIRFLLGFVEAAYFVSINWCCCYYTTDIVSSPAACSSSHLGTQGKSLHSVLQCCTLDRYFRGLSQV